MYDNGEKVLTDGKTDKAGTGLDGKTDKTGSLVNGDQIPEAKLLVTITSKGSGRARNGGCSIPLAASASFFLIPLMMALALLGLCRSYI